MPAGDGTTPTFVAAQRGHEQVVRALISGGGNANTPMSDGASPSFIAGAFGRAGVIRALAEGGADVNARRDDVAWTAFYTETFHVDPSEKFGWSPLMIAAFNGHVDAVSELLKAGADAKAALPDGRTALKIAKQKGNSAVVRLLSRRGL